MAMQLINIGNVVNDGLGDDLRTAFEKVNANFQDIADNILASGKNVGNGQGQIFKQKNLSEFEFRTIVNGEGITITQSSNTVEISSAITNSFKSITTNSGTLTAASYENFTLSGGESTDVIYDDAQTITVDTVKINNKSFKSILEGYDFGPINGNYDNAVQFVVANALIDFGTIEIASSTNLDAGVIEHIGMI